MYPDLLLRQNIPLNRVLAVRKHSSLFFHNYNRFRALRDLTQRYDVHFTQRTPQRPRRMGQVHTRPALPVAAPPQPSSGAPTEVPGSARGTTRSLQVGLLAAPATNHAGPNRAYTSSSTTSTSSTSTSVPFSSTTTSSTMRTWCPASSPTTSTVSSTRMTPSVKTSVTGS